MLAVHELAANAVNHGPGAGRLRMWVAPGRLYCQLDDDGPATRARRDGAGQAGRRPVGSIGDQADPWPYRQGHGLWLVQAAADQMSALSGPGGSRMTVMFALPGHGRIPGTS